MSEPTNPVLLTEVPTEADAILLRDALAEHGVRTVYNGAAIAGFRAEAPAMVRLLVDEDDLERAKSLIAEHGLDSGGEVDWSQVDVGESEEPNKPARHAPLVFGGLPFSWFMLYVAAIAVVSAFFLLNRTPTSPM